MKLKNSVQLMAALLGVVVAGCGLNLPGSISAKTAPLAIAPKAEAFCDKSSWVAGITELCAGHLVYRDYLYDDYGASNGIRSSPPAAGTLSYSTGSARYPTGAENTADLVRLDLSLDSDEVVVEFELNTLYKTDQTIAALAIDTDNNLATGTETLLGQKVTGADLVQQFKQGDPATNLIIGRFPKPKGDVWKIWAVVAQSDGTVMNVAFRGTDEGTTANTSSFWEDKQAAALRAADISAFAATVSVADLAAGVTRGAEIPPGLHQRVYTSAYTLAPGEGISVNGVPGRHGRTQSGCEQYFHYLSKYQPYGFYLPAKPGPHGLVVQLHGCNANHSSQINGAGFQKQFGEDLDRIIVSPLGRGSVGWYSDISERDVLDVMDDMLGQYDIDPDQVLVSGYSMGGYGTVRMAEFYPDRFAAAVDWVGDTGSLYNTPLPGNPVTALERQVGDAYAQMLGSGTKIASGDSGCIGDIIDFVGNLRHVPFVALYSGGDYLVPVPGALALMQGLSNAVDVVYDFYIHPVAEHLTYAVLDSWQKEADFTAKRTRLKNPAHVSYRTDAVLDYPEYQIKHDRAYWVSEIVSRGKGYSDVDLKSLACGKDQEQFTTGQDEGVGPLVLAWLRGFRHVSGTSPMSAQNRIEGTLSNVASLSIDASATCLAAGTSYSLTTDGPVTLKFSDGRSLSLTASGLNEGTIN